MKKDLDTKINDYIEKVEKFKSEHKMNFLEKFMFEYSNFIEQMFALEIILLPFFLCLFETNDELIFFALIFHIIGIFSYYSGKSKHDKIENYKKYLLNELFNNKYLMNLYIDNVKELERKLKTDKSSEIKIIVEYYYCSNPLIYHISFKEYHNTITENIIKSLKLPNEYCDIQLHFKHFYGLTTSKEYLEVEMYKFIKKEIGEVKIIDETSYNKARKKFGFVVSVSGNVNQNILVKQAICNWPRDSKGCFYSYDDKIAEDLIEDIIESYKILLVKNERKLKEEVRRYGMFRTPIEEDMIKYDKDTYFYKLCISYCSEYIKNYIKESINKYSNKKKLIRLKCTSCNTDLSIEGKRDFLFCEYCGTKLIIDNEN